LTVELTTTGHLPLHARREDVPISSEILGVGISSEVVGIEVADVFQLRNAVTFVVANIVFESFRNATSSVADRALIARQVRPFGVRVKGGPNANGPETCPLWDVESQGAWVTGDARKGNSVLDRFYNSWILHKVAEHFDPFDHGDRLRRIFISHFQCS
jgi:hypothetical protein